MNNQRKVPSRRQMLGVTVGLSGLALTTGIDPVVAREANPYAARDDWC